MIQTKPPIWAITILFDEINELYMNIFTIKNKLYAIAGFVTLTMIFLGFVFYSSFNYNQQLNRAMTTIESANAAMLMLRRNEKDFLARLDIKYEQKFQANEKILSGKIEQLSTLVEQSGLSYQEDLDKLKQHIQSYASSFYKVIQLQQLIGLTHNEGLRGQLRNAVHKAEKELNALNLDRQTADMLMLRRNEKDFIIRMLPKYLDKYDKNFNVFMTHLKQSGIDQGTSKKIQQHMQDYQKGFHALVDNYKQLGLDHKSGLHGDMRSAIHQTESIFTQLSEQLSRRIESEQQAANLQTALIMTIIAAVIIALLVLQASNINRRLQIFAKLRNIVSDNQLDLTVSLDESGKDELAEISRMINVFITSLNSLISKLPEVSTRLKTASDTNTELAFNTHELATQQKSQTDEIAVAVDQMISSTREVNKNIHEAANSAEQAKEVAFDGKKKIALATDSINSLSHNMQQSTAITSQLEINSNDISQVLDVIRSIAEQTNLLALNAAIEAARAGENGRGFAVVADEVRSLAQRTQDSTEEIQSLIEKLQSGVDDTVKFTQDSNVHSSSGVDAMHEAIASFDKITETVNSMFTLNTAIASAAEQQSVVSENILNNIRDISASTELTTDHSNKVMQSGNEFKQISNQLSAMVSHYTI